MRKKLTALLLAALLTLSLAGCGSQNDPQAGGDVTPGTTDAAAAGQVQTPDPADTDGEAIPDLGTVNGGTYTNAYANIACTLDDSWIFYTEEEIAELNGLVLDSTSDDQLRKMLEENASIQDMYASSTDGLMTINVVFQNLGLVRSAALSLQEYAELAAEQVPGMMETFGYSDITAKIAAVDFAGLKNQPALALTATVEDVPMYELQVYVKVDTYVYSITLCSFVEDVTADMAALFTAAQ